MNDEMYVGSRLPVDAHSPHSMECAENINRCLVCHSERMLTRCLREQERGIPITQGTRAWKSVGIPPSKPGVRDDRKTANVGSTAATLSGGAADKILSMS